MRLIDVALKALIVSEKRTAIRTAKAGEAVDVLRTNAKIEGTRGYFTVAYVVTQPREDHS
jgi:hypothetical protein